MLELEKVTDAMIEHDERGVSVAFSCGGFRIEVSEVREGEQ